MDNRNVLQQMKLIPSDIKQKEWDAKETIEGSQQKATKALEDAKAYTDANAYELPTASTEVLGGVKVGAGLTIDGQGILSATGGGEADSVHWDNVVGKPQTFKPETHKHSMSELTDYVAPTVDAELNKDSKNAIQNKVITTELEQMKKDIGDLLYKPITINSFSNNVNTVEMGRTITTITLNWALSKTPKTLMLNSETLGNSEKTKTLNGLSIKSNTTYTLKATDEREHTVTKTTSITFLNGVYYGIAQSDAEINDALLQEFTKKLQGSKGATFTLNAGEGQHIFYAVPSRYGACSFNVGGFDGGFSKVSTFNFTNASGHSENYDVYKSDNANLGNTTVKVS